MELILKGVKMGETLAAEMIFHGAKALG